MRQERFGDRRDDGENREGEKEIRDGKESDVRPEKGDAPRRHSRQGEITSERLEEGGQSPIARRLANGDSPRRRSETISERLEEGGQSPMARRLANGDSPRRRSEIVS
jgi:hypothetical protein